MMFEDITVAGGSGAGNTQASWWEKILNAGVSVVGSVWGNQPVTYPGAPAPGTYYPPATQTNWTPIILVAGAVALIALSSKRRR